MKGPSWARQSRARWCTSLAVTLGVYLHAFELLATSIETTTGV